MLYILNCHLRLSAIGNFSRVYLQLEFPLGKTAINKPKIVVFSVPPEIVLSPKGIAVSTATCSQNYPT